MPSRRRFLRTSALTAGVFGTAPGWLLRAAAQGSSNRRILVVIFQRGAADGLNIVAHAIDWQPGDNVVVCTDLEHPNNVYLWLALRSRGVEVRMPKAKDGAIDTQAMIAAIF